MTNQISKTLTDLAAAVNQLVENQVKINEAVDSLASGERQKGNLTKAESEIVAKNQDKITYHRRARAALDRELQKVWAGEDPGYDDRAQVENNLRKQIHGHDIALAALGFDNRANLDDPARSAFIHRGGTSTFLREGILFPDDLLGVNKRIPGTNILKSEDDDDKDLSPMVI